MSRIFHSRFVKKEEAKSLRKAFVFIVLTIFLVVALLFWGLPTLIKIAVFFSSSKANNIDTQQSQTLLPSPPRINSLPENTNNPLVSVSGFAESQSIVEIFLNNASAQKITVGDDGAFRSQDLTLLEGRNEIYAQVLDKDNRTSQPSKTFIVILDKTPPELIISQPENEAIFYGEKQKKIQIQGKTEPQATLTINGHLEVLDKDGNFSATYSMTEGENLLKIASVDLAGNITEKEIKVNFSP